MSQLSIAKLRSELLNLRARYDDGAVNPGVYATIRALEEDIAWAEHVHNTRHTRSENGKA